MRKSQKHQYWTTQNTHFPLLAGFPATGKSQGVRRKLTSMSGKLLLALALVLSLVLGFLGNTSAAAENAYAQTQLQVEIASMPLQGNIQDSVESNTAVTLAAMQKVVLQARRHGVDLVVFPEGLLWCVQCPARSTHMSCMQCPVCSDHL